MTARVVAVLNLVVLLSGLVAASGTLNRTPASHEPVLSVEQRQVLALVDVPAADVGYKVNFAASRAGVRAITDPRVRTITIYAAPFDEPVRVAHDLAHELGHAYDASSLDAAQRKTYLSLRGAAGTAWWPRDVADYDSGAGDFAEVFAACHAPGLEFRSTVAPRPSHPCAVIADAVGGGR